MFLGLLFRLRNLGVPVGAQEAVALAEALAAGLHGSTPTGFYYTARSVLIHHEGHLDAFDRAFLAEYAGITADAAVTDELRHWLAEAAAGSAPDLEFHELTPEQVEELKREFERRLAEQKERHDGGNYWIGTRGSSPFGHSGAARPGIRVGGSGGNRSAVHVADARRYSGYRSDITLDTRQLEVALRRLRAFVREGAADELDIERTIDETARNAGEIEIVTRPPSRPDTHVVLMVDVGGSMYPYSALMSRLFSAAKRATHFKELRTYHFHNVVYGQVYATDRFTDPKWVHDLLAECGSHYKLIMVGDALMAPYELFAGGAGFAGDTARRSGLEWLQLLADHFTDHVWLNPEPQSRWIGTTIEEIGRVFPMHPMTVDGLTEAMALLNRGAPARRR
jgi:hypothetical protein